MNLVENPTEYWWFLWNTTYPSITWWEICRRAVTRKLTCSTGQGQCRMTVQVGPSTLPSNVSPDSDRLQTMPLRSLPQGEITRRESTKSIEGGDAARVGGCWPASTTGGSSRWDESRVLLEEKPAADDVNRTKFLSEWFGCQHKPPFCLLAGFEVLFEASNVKLNMCIKF